MSTSSSQPHLHRAFSKATRLFLTKFVTATSINHSSSHISSASRKCQSSGRLRPGLNQRLSEPLIYALKLRHTLQYHVCFVWRLVSAPYIIMPKIQTRLFAWRVTVCHWALKPYRIDTALGKPPCLCVAIKRLAYLGSQD